MKEFQVTHVLGNTPFYKEGINPVIIDYGVSNKVANSLNYYLENRGKKFLYFLRKRKARKELEPFVKESDVIFVDYATTAVKILDLVKKYRRPLIVHFHGYDITSSISSSWYQQDLNELYSLGKYFIAASFHIKRLLILNGCPEEKIKVVRLGISLPESAVKNIIPYPERKNDFVFIGRLTPKKNPIALLHAFKKVFEVNPATNLHIVGDGPLLLQAKALVQTWNLQDHVVFHGAVPHEKVLKLLKNSKIYVQHSVTSISGDQEGFAISLAEAAMFKMPVISTLHNGIPENVIDNKTGYLVREFDYETMADKMLVLLTQPALAQEMGEMGRKHISVLCSTEERIKKITALIKSASKK